MNKKSLPLFIALLFFNNTGFSATLGKSTPTTLSTEQKIKTVENQIEHTKTQVSNAKQQLQQKQTQVIQTNQQLQQKDAQMMELNRRIQQLEQQGRSQK